MAMQHLGRFARRITTFSIVHMIVIDPTPP